MVNTSKIRAHMEVFGSCGNRIGTVDGVEGNFLKLTRDDPAANGQHHFIPLDWVKSVGQDVRLRLSCEEARANWQTQPQRQPETVGVGG